MLCASLAQDDEQIAFLEKEAERLWAMSTDPKVGLNAAVLSQRHELCLGCAVCRSWAFAETFHDCTLMCIT